ncbi:MAG TPA: hypothetical protein VNO75_06125 [Gemmatimonadaceae bacterium]|nr:hypothetical protein [Gemmatimonadaceae bacterium]
MLIALKILGILMVIAGFVWFLQGIDVLPGSFMTGEKRWAAYGAILAGAGIGLLVFARRWRPDVRRDGP